MKKLKFNLKNLIDGFLKIKVVQQLRAIFIKFKIKNYKQKIKFKIL